MNIEDVVKECALDIFDGRGVEPTIRNALTKQAEAFKGELQAYDGMVRELTKTVEDMREAQVVPVVGEPTDAAYKWMIANGAEPMTSLHKLGERLAAFLDEDQFSGCETLLLTAITAINTFVPVPAAELASLREKDAMVDELRKDAERYRWLRIGKNDAKAADLIEDYCDTDLDSAIDTAIAQGKGE